MNCSEVASMNGFGCVYTMSIFQYELKRYEEVVEKEAKERQYGFAKEAVSV